MTAEIVIINKEAIALAADSAVTAGIGDGGKIFTTADKIFNLAENKPVGVMIFNSASFLGIPWETIINDIKQRLPKTGFDKLDDYADFFLKYFSKKDTFLSKEHQLQHFGDYLLTYFLSILKDIKNTIKQRISSQGSISEASVKQIIGRLIKHDLEEWEQIPDDHVSSISLESSRKIVRRNRRLIAKVLDYTFQRIPISHRSRRNLFEIASFYIAKGASNYANTGIIVAGFGEKEAFPTVRSFVFETLVGYELKYFTDMGDKIDDEHQGSLIAFAQKEMVNRFMEGVDPIYREREEEFLSQLSENFSKELVKKLRKYNAAERKALRQQIKDTCQEISKGYRKAMDDMIQEEFINPITEVVGILPKSDLATLAEALVNITSIKRRFSRERETVAEPIDVAVISKIDGFVWIKKKRYYKD